MLEALTPQERLGIDFIFGSNEKAKETVDAVLARQSRSVAWHKRSQLCLSGTPSLLAYEAPMLPLCIERAKGARIVDVDGNEYIDCHLAYTADILGHNPPEVERSVRNSLSRGIGGGHLFSEQVELAELVTRMVPDSERVAYFHTGGEAISAAVRLAKAETGRPCVAKFEGCYHGSNEIGLHNTWMVLAGPPADDPIDSITPKANTGGLKSSPDADMLILPFNSPVAFDRIRERAGDLACIVADPLPAFLENSPEVAKAFVTELARVARECDVPLIFDEVICGFRIAKGGAREWSGVTPQMSCFGKISSGLGIPLSLVVGEARFLDRCRTDGLFRDFAAGKVWHASTLSSNFVAVAAALAQLRYLSENYDELMKRLDGSYEQLTELMEDFSRSSGIPVTLQGSPRTHLRLAVGEEGEPVDKTYRGSLASGGLERLRTFFGMMFYLRLHGVYVKWIPSMNLSCAHTEEDVSRLADGVAASLLHMDKDGMLFY